MSSPDIDFQALPYARAPEAGYHPHALARAASFDALARAPAAAYEAFAHAPTAGYDDVIAAASAGDYEARVRAYAPGRDALARAPSGSSVQLFSPDLPEDMTPGEVWLEPQNLADEPPHEATAAFKTIADGSAFPGAAEMEMGDEGAAELNEQLQVDHQNGVDLVSAHLIDTLSSTYQQYEAGMETPLSRERDRLLALESVQAPGPYHARWETDSLEQGMDAGLAEPPVEPLHASNLGSLFPALDAFDDIPSSVKSSQSLPLAVQDPVFGAFDGTLGDSGVNALQVVPMVGEPVPQTAGAGNNRAETEEGAVLEGGRRNSSSMNSEDPPETGLAGSFHDVLLEGLEEESKRKEAVADETVQEMTIQFDGEKEYRKITTSHQSQDLSEVSKS